MRPAKPRTLAQMKPLVMLWRRLPSIRVTLPWSTDTARLQASGQSSGHEVSTVLRPQLRSSLIVRVYSLARL
jgi:hypothetical protein